MSKLPDASKTVRMTADRYRQVVAELRDQLGEDGASQGDQDSEPYDPIEDMNFAYMEQPEDLERLARIVEDLEHQLARYKAILAEEEKRARERGASNFSRPDLFGAIRNLEMDLHQCRDVIAQSSRRPLDNGPSIHDIDQYHANSEGDASFTPFQTTSSVAMGHNQPDGMWAAPAQHPQGPDEEGKGESFCCCCF